MLRAYKYRLLPTDEQKVQLGNLFGACRFVYNLALETKITAWTSARKNFSFFDLSKQLTELKHTECQWLNEYSAMTLQQSLRMLDNAYINFFKGKGFPRFKKKFGRQSAQFRQKIKIFQKKAYLSKIGWVDFVEHRPLRKGEIGTVTVSKETTGKYFISILIQDHKELPIKSNIKDETTIGIDVGLKTFATLSDGQNFANPKYLHEQLKRLRIEQRKLKRRFKKGAKEQSKSYQKQKLIVAKLHEKIANKRKDFLHKTSTAIIKQYDTICVENLNVKGMMKNEKLAKSLSDVGWYKFIEFLKYKAEWNGKNIIQIGRFEPSSKTCSDCGSVNETLTLANREWVCANCGSLHDRDLNAAKNIKNFGLKAKPSTAKVAH